MYLPLLANVKADLDNTMPLGKGDIYRYHQNISEGDFMHSAFVEHI
jgi:hypothetical protein